MFFAARLIFLELNHFLLTVYKNDPQINIMNVLNTFGSHQMANVSSG